MKNTSKFLLFAGLVFVVAFAVGVAGCLDSNEPETGNTTVVTTETTVVSEILPVNVSVANNTTLTVQMKSNPTTGYTWNLTKNPDGILNETGHNTNVSNSSMAGSPSMESWTFAGITAGTTTYTFVYNRSFEPNSTIQTVQIQTRVNGDMTIDVLNISVW
ncbi:protease inhibitor I42 family protein [Methanolapillus ohkumae]|uniref:Proteinase inhibitor I42 chagasin domain-containing protein n=1 Tax=Methanolapillus ohkumae TaxID=3028298 RepID=A0AA96V5G6_9EURY|nr:hypothetical protein MsAm2_07800 [Methanosarcinaceae archaeon Am2]